MKNKAALKTQAKERARKLLDELEITSAPVPIEKIIKRCQVVLQYAPFEDELSGMAYINEGVSIIGINALHPPNRQRFSAAHELGHHLLHADQLKSAVHVDRGLRVLMRDQIASQGVDPIEIEANAFAAELLMPKSMLKEVIAGGEIDIESDIQIEALAKKFRVSASAIRYRLLGLMDEVQSS